MFHFTGRFFGQNRVDQQHLREEIGERLMLVKNLPGYFFAFTGQSDDIIGRIMDVAFGGQSLKRACDGGSADIESVGNVFGPNGLITASTASR